VARVTRTGVVQAASTGENSAHLLYGAVVSGGTLMVLADHAASETKVVLGTVAVLFIYSMAHLYAHVLSAQLVGGDTRRLRRRVADFLGEELYVVLGGLPTVAVYAVAVAVGASPSSAGSIALVFLVALLFATGFGGARRAGLTGGTALLEAMGAGLFGVFIVVLKSLLH
jgi:hypothetical protein